jgi:hypothetical protein
VREFTTAAKEKIADEHGEVPGRIEFKVDDVTCYADPPKPGQMAMVIAMTARHMPESEQVAGVVEFFNSVLVDSSRNHLIGRLMDPKDDFEAQEVMDIIQMMMEEWGARPTGSRSGSAGSRSGTGRKSKQTTPA